MLLMWQVYFLLQKWKFSPNFFSLHTASNNILHLFSTGGPRARAEVGKETLWKGISLPGLSCSLCSTGEEPAMWDVSVPVRRDMSTLREGDHVLGIPTSPRQLWVIGGKLCDS